MRWPWRRRRSEPARDDGVQRARAAVDAAEGTTIFTTAAVPATSTPLRVTYEHAVSFPRWVTTSWTADVFARGFEQAAELMRDKPDVVFRPRRSPWGAYGGGSPWSTYTRRGNP